MTEIIIAIIGLLLIVGGFMLHWILGVVALLAGILYVKHLLFG
jgi:hypothetical protein